MNVFGTFLDNRDRSPFDTTGTEAQRLLKFDAWVKAELEKRLDWEWAGNQKVKKLEQCRVQLEGLVLDLWRRGWMLDGARLAKVITTALDDVAAAQKARRVQDFWPFFKAIMARHVGVNSEEIQAQARSAGALLSQTLNAIGVTKPAAVATPLPQLVAQRRGEIQEAKTLRSKLSEERRKKVFRESEDGQLGLL